MKERVWVGVRQLKRRISRFWKMKTMPILEHNTISCSFSTNQNRGNMPCIETAEIVGHDREAEGGPTGVPERGLRGNLSLSSTFFFRLNRYNLLQ
jgi:hypothetical protein